MIIFQTSREGIVHSAFVSDAVPVHRVVRAVEFKMATGCKFLSLAASSLKHFAVKDDEKLRYWNARCLKFR